MSNRPIVATCPECFEIVAFTLEPASSGDSIANWLARGLDVHSLTERDTQDARFVGHHKTCKRGKR